MTDPSQLAHAILHALAQEGGAPVSLPRISKRLGLSGSTVLRALSAMGDADLGGHSGPGWVHVRQEDGRWMAQITQAGRAACAQALPAPAQAVSVPALLPVEQRRVRVFGEPGLPPEGALRPDTLAQEIPVALVFNGVSHAVMMATPEHLEDFALGFALSEGILDHARDCRGISLHPADATAAHLPEGVAGVEAHLEISARSFERLKHRRRSMAGRTGCGVCGVESFAALDLTPVRLPPRDWAQQVDLPAVLRAFAGLQAHQPHNALSGSLHAAGWALLDGTLAHVCEDVGRHNALDKLIGRLARQERLAEPGFVALSSRGSHELVRKCARVGLAALATISAPTATGVQVAELAGLRLWGLCRAPRAVLYVP